MDKTPRLDTTPSADTAAARLVSRLAVLLLIASVLLISPDPEEDYPGLIPWRPWSLLQPLTEVMSLGGLVRTARGTEIKDFSFHFIATLGLIALAAHIIAQRCDLNVRNRLRTTWFQAQLLLGCWLLLSFSSVAWSSDADCAAGQSWIYFLSLAWAIAVAWTLRDDQIVRITDVVIVIAAFGALLCIWYFHERSPTHRPGFPVGNPATLSAIAAAALLIAISVAGSAILEFRAKKRWVWSGRLTLAAMSILPLTYCLYLARSRAALLGLGAGVVALAMLHAGRRSRRIITGLTAVVVVCCGIWLYYFSSLDASMARSATIRYRLYTWRYAADIWRQQPVSGLGAGCYPRLAGQFAVYDRSLDPAAFLGHIISHAHNELFEVLAEIGLVGGVTYVGGILATIIAAVTWLLRNRDSQHFPSLAGAFAAFIAILVDSLFSAGLRLQGLPAVFYTLLGLLWAICREDSDREQARPAPLSFSRRPILAPALCAIAACGAGWATLRNGAGLLVEQRAYASFRDGLSEKSAAGFASASGLLLDPLRKLQSLDREAWARLKIAENAHDFAASARSAPATRFVGRSPSLIEAIARAQEAFNAASGLMRRAPSWYRIAAVCARAAELLADLHLPHDPETATEWARTAAAAWRLQRQWLRYDFDTLLSLLRYLPNIDERIGLLRDALRASDAEMSRWNAAFALTAAEPGFAEALARLNAAIAPLNAQTDADTLVASLTPETYRLSAAWHALRGDFSAAERAAARAVDLYVPMRTRFPTLQSTALRDQAVYLLRDNPAQAARAAEILRSAMERLPIIQKTAYDRMLLPYRVDLIRCLLAGEKEAEAREVLREIVTDSDLDGKLVIGYLDLASMFIIGSRAHREHVERWLSAALAIEPSNAQAWGWRAYCAAQTGRVADVEVVLAAAQRAGLPASQIGQIRSGLAERFPDLGVVLQPPE